MRDQVAIITGASSGIGATTADRLALRYGGLVLHARKSAEALEAVAERIRKQGTTVVTVLGDLVDAATAGALVEAASGTFGRLDGIVANAGFPISTSFAEGGRDDLEHGFRGNVFSFFDLVRAAEPLIRLSPAGRIVAVGSFTAHAFRTDLRQFPLSAASKGALETAVRSLALHLSNSGVTVNCIVPGFIRKDAGTGGLSSEELEESRKRIPLGRIGRPADVAAAIDYLMSEDAGYVTGQSLHVSGGLVI